MENLGRKVCVCACAPLHACKHVNRLHSCIQEDLYVALHVDVPDDDANCAIVHG